MLAPSSKECCAYRSYFLSANLFKFFDGGWLPIVVALVTLSVMIAWIRGRDRLLAARWRDAVPLKDFLSKLSTESTQRVKGTGIFMVPLDEIAPMALLHNLKHNKVLHERVLLMRTQVESVPHISDEGRVEVHHLPHNFHAVIVRYGFMEEPNIPRALALLRAREFHFSLLEISFFVGKEKVVSRGAASWFLGLFILMHRMMMGATEYFKIPSDHAVELGGHIEI